MKPGAYPLTPELQAVLVRNLVADPRTLPRLAPYLKPDRLSDERAQLLATAAIGYYRARGRTPTLQETLQEVRLQVDAGKITNEQLEACGALFEESYSGSADPGYLVDLVLKEERSTAMIQALDVGLSRWKDRTPEAFEAIERQVSAANMIGRVETGSGIDQFATLAARTKARASGNVAQRIGTGVIELDDSLNGGLGPGELGCVLGAAKAGKSSALSQICLYNASWGRTSVLLTLEMGEQEMTDRHDAMLSSVAIANLAHEHKQVERRVRAWFEKTKGRMEVRYLRPYQTTAKDIRALLQTMKLEHGIEPSLLAVDYAGRMGASKRSEKRHNEVGYVYAELRDLATELKIPVWTGHQANREALGAREVDLQHIADSYQAVAEVDLMVAICQTAEEREQKQTRLKVLACRYAPSGTLIGPFPTALECGRLIANAAGITGV